MNERKRNKLSMTDYTGLDLSDVQFVKVGENKKGEAICEYNLRDVSEKIKLSRKEIFEIIPEYFITERDMGGEFLSKCITEEGLMMLLNQFDVHGFDDFKQMTANIIKDVYNYGIYTDEKMTDNLEHICDELMEKYDDEVQEYCIENNKNISLNKINESEYEMTTDYEYGENDYIDDYMDLINEFLDYLD